MPSTYKDATDNAAHANVAATEKPSPVAMLLHLPKTVSLIGATMRDARVRFFPKFMFISSLSILLLALVFPESFADVSALLVPFFGPVFDAIGIPTEGALDWLAIGVAAYNLFKLFPSEVVGEHYDQIFHNGKHTVDSNIVDAD